MKDRISLIGKIQFEPEDKTKKHVNQSSWKKIAMVFLDGDVAEYYAWFIKKRYSLTLNKPLRGAHVSFINDSMRDLTQNGEIPVEVVEKKWEEVKNKWSDKEVEIILDLSPKTNDEHWWLNIPHEERYLLQSIRDELGLGKPFFGMHMSIGYVNDKNLHHSKYIHDLIKKGFITFD
jgi:hypothetical protein